jgi:hypothetical protein
MTTETKETPARTCENCACSHLETNQLVPTEKQLFCRRDPAQAQRVRIEVPRKTRDGQPVMRDGKPVMENGEGMAFLYRPVFGNLTCFDGWRPIGTLPGDKFQNAPLDILMNKALAGIERGLGAFVHDPFDGPAVDLNDLVCPHGKEIGHMCDECGGVATHGKTQ